MKRKIKIICAGTYNNGDVDCACNFKDCPLNVDIGAGYMCNIHTALKTGEEMTRGTIIKIEVDIKENVKEGKIFLDGEEI